MSAVSSITPPAEENVVAGMPSDAPVTMVNLLRFKQPDGLEHYYRYGAEIAPLLRFRLMLDISVPVAGLQFRDAVPVGARQQFR
jgi:hypothetical protein